MGQVSVLRGGPGGGGGGTYRCSGKMQPIHTLFLTVLLLSAFTAHVIELWIYWIETWLDATLKCVFVYMQGLEVSVLIPDFTFCQLGGIWDWHRNFQPLYMLIMQAYDFMYFTAVQSLSNYSEVMARNKPTYWFIYPCLWELTSVTLQSDYLHMETT